ncbi:hypothetical protein D3C85_1424120 [compost metagenome]
MLQHRRAFVDPKPPTFPVVFRFAEHDGLTFERPRVFHFAQIEIGVTGNMGCFLRPQIPTFALMHEGGGIERKRIKRRDDLSFFDPLPTQRIAVCAFQREHPVLEHIQLVESLGMGGGKVDVPLAVNVMQFRRPDQLTHRAGIRFTPDHHFFCAT